jgi:hypothetical protein
MTDPKKQAPPHSKPDPGKDGLTREDAILYLFGLLFAVLMAFFMDTNQQALERGLTAFSQHARAQVEVAADPAAKLNFLRYDYATTMMPSITARANVSIMVGTLLALMGTFLIVRGVRESPLTAEAAQGNEFSFKFAASSPGLVLALLGCIIITVAIWKGGGIEIQDGQTSGRVSSGVSAEETEDALQSIEEALDELRGEE